MRTLPDILGGVGKIKAQDFDIYFTKAKEKGARRINFKEFHEKALTYLASGRYPTLTPEAAVQALIDKHLLPSDRVKLLVRKEATRMYMGALGRRFAAVTRLAAFVRGCWCRFAYQRARRSAIVLQRRVRAFRVRVGYLVGLAERNAARAKWVAAARERRATRSSSRLFSHGQFIDGRLHVVAIHKTSSKDTFISVYEPASSLAFRVSVAVEELKEIVEAELQRAVTSSLELSKNLHVVASKLLFRRVKGKRTLLISKKKGCVERGCVLLKKGVTISGRFFVSTVFLDVTELAFKLYRPDFSDTSTIRFTFNDLARWCSQRKADDPEILQLLADPTSHCIQLAGFVMSHMRVCAHCVMPEHKAAHKSGKEVVMSLFEADRASNFNHLIVIQCFMRCCRARWRTQARALTVYTKQFDSTSRAHYYVNSRTGATRWEKPRLLFTADVPDPPDAWVEVVGSEGERYFYHCSTGRTSRIDDVGASRVVQRLWRRAKGRDFRLLNLAAVS